MVNGVSDDLARTNRDLETRLLERTVELERSNSELERFAFAASHDLKSPLVTIKGFLGLLNKDLESGDFERVADDIKHIALATDQMDRSLDDLRDLTRISLAISSWELFSLSPLCEEIKILLREPIAENGIEIEIAADMPEVFANKNQISDVIRHLLENGIKFCREVDTPKISIAAEVQGNRVQCRVRDNGIGIDPRYQERVFELFEQLDQSVDGTGVGLALIRRTIEIHDGVVWVESDGIDKGTSVYFTLGANSNESR